MTVCTIVWFRRDLRIEDNPALIAAARAGHVVPVFVWSPEEEGQFYPGRVSRWWLKQSLAHLDATLRSLGAPLVIRRARSTFAVLMEVIQATGATQLFYNHLYDPVSLVRDHKVKQAMAQQSIIVQTFNADLLYEPWEVYDEQGQAYTTFDTFWNKCLNMPFEPDAALKGPHKLTTPGVPLPSMSTESLGLEDQQEKSSNALLARAWMPGWTNAERALSAFVQGALQQYASHGCQADNANTSLLSPHMHFGEVSVRKVYLEVRLLQKQWQAEGMADKVKSVDAFLRSLGFREYSRYLSFNFPFTHERSLLANLKSFPWRVDEHSFKAWRQGRTGFPLVDAGMRELWATGWLHNRVRVMVSSFCVKFLQLPWRWGMKYFWDTLLDADLECDVLGWQYISGSLPDGHELDRMDNPEVEGYKFDPRGEYVRRWLPELSRVPTEWIHHPWDAPPHVLRAAGVELGFNYPAPIVEVAQARERLQEALSAMWEREAAIKAVVANGVEEGAGETNIDLDVSGGSRSSRSRSSGSEEGEGAEGPEGAEGAGRHSRLRRGTRKFDQLVPCLPMPEPSRSAVRAAESILHRASGLYRVNGGQEEGARRGVQPPSPMDSSSNDDDSHMPTDSAGEENGQPPQQAQQMPGQTQALQLLGAGSAAAAAQPSKPPVQAVFLLPTYPPYNAQQRVPKGPRLVGGYQKDDDANSTAESFCPHVRRVEVASHLANSPVVVPVWSQSTEENPPHGSPPSACPGVSSDMEREPIAVVPCVPYMIEEGARILANSRRNFHTLEPSMVQAVTAGNEKEEPHLLKRIRLRNTEELQSLSASK